MTISPDVPEPIRELLAAISDTLDVPAPSSNPEDQAAHRILTGRRIHDARLAIRRILGDGPWDAVWEASFLRFQAQQHPPVYRTQGEAADTQGVTPASHTPTGTGREDRVAELHAQAAKHYAEGKAQRRAAAGGLRPGDPGLAALAAEAAEATEGLDTDPA